MQRDCLIHQYNNERQNTIYGQYPQASKFAIENEVNLDYKSNEYIKTWIVILKEIKWRLQKYKPNNIRAFLL